MDIIVKNALKFSLFYFLLATNIHASVASDDSSPVVVFEDVPFSLEMRVKQFAFITNEAGQSVIAFKKTTHDGATIERPITLATEKDTLFFENVEDVVCYFRGLGEHFEKIEREEPGTGPYCGVAFFKEDDKSGSIISKDIRTFVENAAQITIDPRYSLIRITFLVKKWNLRCIEKVFRPVEASPVEIMEAPVPFPFLQACEEGLVYEEESVLVQAIRAGEFDTVQLLVTEGGMNPREANRRGETPLSIAQALYEQAERALSACFSTTLSGSIYDSVLPKKIVSFDKAQKKAAVARQIFNFLEKA